MFAWFKALTLKGLTSASTWFWYASCGGIEVVAACLRERIQRANHVTMA